ncbi:MAG: methylmalonyl Co-A mutase-associated GTPase MeaB, partial [Chitinophagales bacterium]
RPQAHQFSKNLQKLVHNKPQSDWQTPVIKTVATKEEGIAELAKQINAHHEINHSNTKKSHLFTRKALQIIQQKRMKDVNHRALQKQIEAEIAENSSFNLYAFLDVLGY